MAGVYNFTLDQGADFSVLCTYKNSSGTPINLTGMTLAGKARTEKEGSEAFSFSFDIRDQGTYPGQFYLKLANSISSALDVSVVNKFFYDVELTNGSVKTRLIQGVVTISREMTR